MRTLLDPTSDIVFKIMFSRPDSTELLISLLTAVLRPKVPIARVTILNPDLVKAAVTDRGVILDVHVRFEDGSRVNVEMQARKVIGMRERSVYHVARMYGTELVRGDEYFQLTPCVGIFLLGYDELPSSRFHSTFELREVHDHELLSNHIQIHYVELLKLRRACPGEWTDDSKLVDWARFFRPSDEHEREELAMKDPTFAKAKEVLETLSDDPEVQYWARVREEGEVLYRHELAETRKAGQAEGREEGKAEGRAALLLELLTDRFGQVAVGFQARIAAATADDLRRWGNRLLTASTIEDVFGEG